MKQFLIVTILLVSVVGMASGQEESGRGGSESERPAAVKELPALKAEDLLNIRNLQFEQAKRLLEMQSLMSRYEHLQSESQSFQPALKAMIDAAAKAANIDLTKWEFDADSLKFVAKPAPTPAKTK